MTKMNELVLFTQMPHGGHYPEAKYNYEHLRSGGKSEVFPFEIAVYPLYVVSMFKHILRGQKRRYTIVVNGIKEVLYKPHKLEEHNAQYRYQQQPKPYRLKVRCGMQKHRVAKQGYRQNNEQYIGRVVLRLNIAINGQQHHSSEKQGKHPP